MDNDTSDFNSEEWWYRPKTKEEYYLRPALNAPDCPHCAERVFVIYDGMRVI